MLKIIFSVFLLFPAFKVFALEKEAVVIEVRKKVKLHDMERVYADYFIRGGTRLGLTKGTLISVVRRLPVHDPFENASVGDFRVKVADIEIIQADSEKSIGRLIEIDRREARPMLTYDAIMIGDRLDLDTMRAKVSHKRAPSSVFENSPREVNPQAQSPESGNTLKKSPVSMEESQNSELELTNP